MSFSSMLLEVISITAPIFIVIAIGFLIRKKNIISEDGVSLLNKIAYNIGLPSLIFLSITNYNLSDIFNVQLVKVIYLSAPEHYIIENTRDNDFFKQKSVYLTKTYALNS